MKAYRILESMSDKEMTLTICNSLLKQNLHVSQTLFLIQFMLINLHDHLSPIRTSQLLCTKIGAKALLCLPEVSRPNYEHLVSRPLLLLEQLLMNMKVEWAVSVFRHLQVSVCWNEICSVFSASIPFRKRHFDSNVLCSCCVFGLTNRQQI